MFQGIRKYVVVLPDRHEGYGFPVGGVAAMDLAEGGVISPGEVGYDIIYAGSIKNERMKTARKMSRDM